MSVVLNERTKDVMLVTVNRPEKKNALSLEVVEELHGLLATLERDDQLAAVILTGAGDDFMAGADIAQLKERTAADALASINGTLFRRLEKLPMPTIAAVRGYALGGGCELALACDIRIAGESAVLGQPEVGLGIIPGAGATYRLPELVGLGRAKELIFTGAKVSAREALDMGLVNRVVADEDLLDAAQELAGRIQKQGRLAVRMAKMALEIQAGSRGSGGIAERLAQGVLFESEEKHRRMQKFLDRTKKQPD